MLRVSRVRHALYRLLEERASVGARLVDAVLVALILGSVVLESTPTLAAGYTACCSTAPSRRLS